MPTKRKNDALKYQAMIERIKVITAELQNGTTDVDKMIEEVQEAVELIQACRERLARTGLQVNEALDRLNAPAADEKVDE